MKRNLSLLWLAALFSCDNPVDPPNNQFEAKSDNVALDISYNVKKTSFQEWDKASNAAHPEINRTIPIITKEKVGLKILHSGEAELQAENIFHDEDLFKTEAAAGQDKRPDAQYYKIANGVYSVYDANRELIFEQPTARLDLSNVLAGIKNKITNPALLPAYLTGGVYLPTGNRSSGAALRGAEHPLHNSYDDNPAYEVIRETYTDELDGLIYTQETIVRGQNRTMVWVSAYDQNYNLLSRTSFRYGGTENAPVLLSTQDVYYEQSKNGVVKHINISEYENFSLALNL